ncbi:MAG: hypothetical protein IPL96_16355 [Holophagaceae bacterium]|nr:hypothetical protein [Holophagaceae bacterium]
MPDEAPKLPRLPLPLRKQKALKAAWKPLLANWALPGAGYWMIGQKGRAKAIFGIFVGFTVIGFLQMKLGAGDGPVGGVFTPALDPFQWMPTLGAAATAGIGPIYGLFAAMFGGASAEPVRNLTQEYGASYVMVAGLLNWLCCFDIFDRVTGRWVWRLPKDEQEALAAKAEEVSQS